MMMDLVQDSLNVVPSVKRYRTAKIIDGNPKYFSPLIIYFYLI
jgi:hypothetical protein